MKYMGSKARLIKEIAPIILADRKPEQWYVEPFAGGMNSICEIPGNRIANDVNAYLIQMWELLLLDWIPGKISKEIYQDAKENPHKYTDGLVGWIGFNCSYSGKWFAGYAGETQTKYGVRDYQTEAVKNVLAQVKKLQGVILKNKSYDSLEIPPKSIIYCDPPYQGTTKYRTDFDNAKFWDWARLKGSEGHTVFVSEYQAPDDFECVWSKEIKSSLSANGTFRGSKTSTEKLFKYLDLGF